LQVALLIVAALAGVAAYQVLPPPDEVWGVFAVITASAGMVYGEGWEMKHGKQDNNAALAAWGGVACCLVTAMMLALVKFAFTALGLAP
jgi:hypothetical protein